VCRFIRSVYIFWILLSLLAGYICHLWIVIIEPRMISKITRVGGLCTAEMVENISKLCNVIVSPTNFEPSNQSRSYPSWGRGLTCQNHIKSATIKSHKITSRIHWKQHLSRTCNRSDVLCL